MTRPLRILAAGIVACLAASCNTGPYPSLGQEIDILQPLGNAAHVSFMRTMNDRLEMLVVAKADPDDADSVPRFIYSTIGENDETKSWAGTWNYREEASTLVLNSQILFVRPDEVGVSPINAGGSYSEEDSRTLIITYRPSPAEISSDELFNGDVGSLADGWVHLDEVLDALDPDTQKGAEELFSLVYASTFTVLPRIPSFGGAGMIQYTDPGGTFNSLLGGPLHVLVTGLAKPESFLTYDEYSDLSGVVMDGGQNNVTNTKGEGYYHGTLDFEIRAYNPSDEPDDTGDPVDDAQEEPPDEEPPGDTGTVDPITPYSGDAVFQGEIFFGNPDGTDSVLLEAPLPSGGEFKFTVNGNRYEIGAKGFTVRTLNGLLEELANASPGEDP